MAIWKKIGGDNFPPACDAYVGLAGVAVHKGDLESSRKFFEKAIRLRFAKLSNRELCDYFHRAEVPELYWSHSAVAGRDVQHREAYLTEMIRRGGKLIEKSLKTKTDLAAVTALRRIQKKSDPFHIVFWGGMRRESIYPNLPNFRIELTNYDVEGKPIRFHKGGDDRSGRHERWRLEVRNQRGELIDVDYRFYLNSGIAGGVFSYEKLTLGESWKTTLTSSLFVHLEPGDYQVRIQYHDQATIAKTKTPWGLIVCQSVPIRVHVQPRVINVIPQERKKTQQWLSNIPEKTELRILVAPYEKGAHEFISPDSLPGKILAQEWKAVPGLLDALESKELTPRQRAWALSLLFSITGRNDPRWRSGVLPDYKYQEGARTVLSGISSSSESQSIRFGAGGSISGASIEQSTQKKFAQQWKKFWDFIIVREITNRDKPIRETNE